MKRPQFSLLLVLLITALFAVVIAWRQAASRYNEHANAMEIEKLKHDIVVDDAGKGMNKAKVTKIKARLKELEN